jgi:hypothetical protein
MMVAGKVSVKQFQKFLKFERAIRPGIRRSRIAPGSILENQRTRRVTKKGGGAPKHIRRPSGGKVE